MLSNGQLEGENKTRLVLSYSKASSESVLPMACSNTKVDPECGLTNLWLVLDVRPSS